MAERLLPCGACLRHVRCSELACPFCGAAASMATLPSAEPFRRLAAAAAVAAGVAALTACGDSGSATGDGGAGLPEDADNGDNGASDDFSGVVFYGSVGFEDGSVSNGITCRTSAGCLPGQVCCGAVTMTSSCQVGPCPPTPFGSLQLCGISDECLMAGDTCGPMMPPLPPLGVMVCNAPSEGGTGEGGLGEDGSSGDGDGGSDTGLPDAPAGD